MSTGTPISITKDRTFWFVVERALKEYKEEKGPSLVDNCLKEISAAIDQHLTDSL